MSRKILNSYAYCAVCYPLGLMPKAPGTFGSLPGLLLGYGIFQASSKSAMPFLSAGLMLLIFMLFSWWIIYKTETFWGTHDDKSIVIDEVAGQAIPLAFFEPSLMLYILSFALFRLLDISKPLIIGWVDKNLSSSLGTLLDDVLAGLGVLLILILGIYADVI